MLDNSSHYFLILKKNTYLFYKNQTAVLEFVNASVFDKIGLFAQQFDLV